MSKPYNFRQPYHLLTFIVHRGKVIRLFSITYWRGGAWFAQPQRMTSNFSQHESNRELLEGFTGQTPKPLKRPILFNYNYATK